MSITSDEMNCVANKTQLTSCKMNRKNSYILIAAFCLSITSLVVTILCGTGMLLMWSKHMEYENAISKLEIRVKRCEQPMKILKNIAAKGKRKCLWF